MNNRTVWRVLTIALSVVIVFGVFSFPLDSITSEPTTVNAQSCGNSWEARYYNGTNFDQLVWIDCLIPGANGWLQDGFGNPAVPTTNFTATYQRQVNFGTPGTYVFDVTVEDGVRVYVNGVQVIDAWGNSAGPREITQEVQITAPISLVYVEYLMTGTRAELAVEWIFFDAGTGGTGGTSGGGSTVQPTATPTCNDTPSFTEPWTVEFFATRDFSGPVVASGSTGLAGPLNYNFSGPPIVGLPADDWSARYSRRVDFQPGGPVTFTMFVDDVGTVYLDDQPVTASAAMFDGSKTYEATVDVSPGAHVIRVDWADFAAEAIIDVDWTGSESGGGSSCDVQGAGSPTGVTATVNANVGLNFRDCPSLSCNRISVLPSGSTYTVLGRNNDGTWAQLDNNGQVGWALAEWLSFSGDFMSVPIVTPGADPTSPLPDGVPIRAVGNVRIRECPSLRCARITYVPWGTQVQAYGKSANGYWLKIGYDDPELGQVIGWSYALWYFDNDFKLPLPELPVLEE